MPDEFFPGLREGGKKKTAAALSGPAILFLLKVFCWKIKNDLRLLDLFSGYAMKGHTHFHPLS